MIETIYLCIIQKIFDFIENKTEPISASMYFKWLIRTLNSHKNIDQTTEAGKIYFENLIINNNTN